MTHGGALRLPRIFISLVPYLRYFLGCPPILRLQLVAFRVHCPAHLSREGISVVKADSEGWTVFLGRRVILGVLSPDCNQNRTSLARAGRQHMRVVMAGSEGAADESTPDCPHHIVLLLLLFFVVFLTLTDPLRIQPWSQDRRNHTKSNRESEVSRESRQKRTDKKVASKGHRRDKI